MSPILRFLEGMEKEEKLQAISELLEEVKDALEEVLDEYDDEEEDEVAGYLEEALDILEDCCGSVYGAIESIEDIEDLEGEDDIIDIEVDIEDVF